MASSSLKGRAVSHQINCRRTSPILLRVVITDLITDDLLPERAILDDIAELAALGALCEDQLVGRVEQADALIVYHEISLSHNTIQRLECCKVIVRGGVGIDNVDWQFAGDRGIPVVNVPDYGAEEVADTAIAMTLALTRGVHFLNSRLRNRDGHWTYNQTVPLRRLRGQTFGIVGLGRIGTAVAVRAKALGMDVLYFDPYKPDGYDKAQGISRAETFDQLLSQSYVVSLHCPLTTETSHLIDAAALASMPQGSYLINTARGGVVDASALLEAISVGRLAGAGIDVLEKEPPEASDPLLTAWQDPRHPAYHRLILNPHAAFYSEEGQLELRRKTAEACRRALLGLPLRNQVNNCAVSPGGNRPSAPGQQQGTP